MPPESFENEPSPAPAGGFGAEAPDGSDPGVHTPEDADRDALDGSQSVGPRRPDEPSCEPDGAPDQHDSTQRQPDGEFYQALVGANADTIAVIDSNGNISFISDSVRRVLGLEPDSVIGTSGFGLIHPDDHGTAAESLLSTVSDGGVREPLLLRLRNADGTWHPVEILTVNLSTDPRVNGLVITARDMLARRDSRQTADSAARLFEQVFERAPIGLAIVENDGSVRRANGALAAMLGVSIQELTGANLVALAHHEDRRKAADFAFAVLGGAELAAMELRFVKADGSIAWARATATLVVDDDGSPLYSVVQIEDVTEQQILRQKLHRAATHDPLTGVLNRAGLEAAYEQYCRNANGSSAFVLIDIDCFKPVNDKYGHHAGDQLLKYIAGRLTRTVRGETTIARIGGDEFVAHVGGVADIAGAEVIGERLRRTLVAPFVVQGKKVYVSGSIGVAFLDGIVDLESAMLASDRASYQAKHAGGDRVVSETVAGATASGVDAARAGSANASSGSADVPAAASGADSAPAGSADALAVEE